MVSLSGPNLRTFFASSSVKPFTVYPRVPYLAVLIRSSTDSIVNCGNCFNAQATIPSFSATVTVHVLYTNVPFGFRRRTACAWNVIVNFSLFLPTTTLAHGNNVEIARDNELANLQRRTDLVARGRKNEVAPVWSRCTTAVADLMRYTECPREYDQSDSLGTAAHRHGWNRAHVRRRPLQHRNKIFLCFHRYTFP